MSKKWQKRLKFLFPTPSIILMGLLCVIIFFTQSTVETANGVRGTTVGEKIIMILICFIVLVLPLDFILYILKKAFNFYKNKSFFNNSLKPDKVHHNNIGRFRNYNSFTDSELELSKDASDSPIISDGEIETECERKSDLDMPPESCTPQNGPEPNSDNDVPLLSENKIEVPPDKSYKDNNKIEEDTEISPEKTDKSLNHTIIVDSYFKVAGFLVIQKGKASIGMLQRTFKIGFNRASKIIKQLTDAKVLMPPEGIKPQKSLMSSDEFENLLTNVELHYDNPGVDTKKTNVVYSNVAKNPKSQRNNIRNLNHYKNNYGSLDAIEKAFYKDALSLMLSIVKTDAMIVNSTSNLEEFIHHWDNVIKTLNILAEHEFTGFFTGNLPTENLNTIIRNKTMTEISFIRRAFTKDLSGGYEFPEEYAKYLSFFTDDAINFINTGIEPFHNEESEYEEKTVYGMDKNDFFDNMSGLEFEKFCAELLQDNAFNNVQVTQGSGDHGIDIFAEKYDITYAIQCKCYSGNVGNSAIQQANAGKQFYKKDIAVVLTNRDFTQQAKEEAEILGVKLWDRKKLIELVRRELSC